MFKYDVSATRPMTTTIVLNEIIAHTAGVDYDVLGADGKARRRGAARHELVNLQLTTVVAGRFRFEGYQQCT